MILNYAHNHIMVIDNLRMHLVAGGEKTLKTTNSPPPNLITLIVYMLLVFTPTYVKPSLHV